MKWALVRFTLFTGTRLDVFNGKNPDEVVLSRHYVRREEARLTVRSPEEVGGGWVLSRDTEGFLLKWRDGSLPRQGKQDGLCVGVVRRCVCLVWELMKSSQLTAFTY